MDILVVNTGSSSLKLRVVDDDDEVVRSEDLPRVPSAELAGVLAGFLGRCGPIGAAGHRVVHGGSAYREPVLLDAAVDTVLEELADLAPLHNPPSLAAIEALTALRPELAQVACFDTAFHADMPATATTYAVPRAWRERWDLRRFGFHGLSHSWASRRAGQLMGRPREQLRLVTAHLGSGASLAAVALGRSVDTTMGFTPIEGLVMATRSGSVDPGLVLWVQRKGGLSPDDVEAALEHDSGLSGLCAGSGDLRAVMTAADGGDPDARLAYGLYGYRIRTGVAAMVAAMGGVDGLVFTGGAGEASARLRRDVCEGLGFLGFKLDGSVNDALGADGLVSAGAGGPTVAVVRAREDLEIARHVRELVA
ncbi:MAG: acetate/propionate family kinase [Acidimicrobiales bacterium]